VRIVCQLVGPALVLAAAPALGAELFCSPVLPLEGEPFKVVYRAGTQAEGGAAFTVRQSDGSVLVERKVPLAEQLDGFRAELELTVPHNGLLRADVVAGHLKLRTVVPVISAKREVNLIYYGMSKELIRRGLVHWVTLVTTCGGEVVEDLNRRGAKALRWHWGSNVLGDREAALRAEGRELTPEVARQMGRGIYTADAAEAVKQGYAGFGLDEFGGYAASEFLENTKAFVRGMIDAREELPPGFILAAWHGGPIDSELMGLYKQAVEFLLPEAYLLDIVPSQLGTELIDKDLEGRLITARSNDMFTAPYGSRCRVIPSVDLTDRIPVDEYEGFFRMLRREFPEVRGIAFFNVLSEEHYETYRVVDQLCLDYFIHPVLTFQPDSISFDRFGDRSVIARLSNIGAMDSGPVTVRLLVDDKEVGRATVPSVPAGFSRVDNRATARFHWRPKASGTFRLRAEVVDAGDATVLDPGAEASMYLRP